jgi:hypothetical protein
MYGWVPGEIVEGESVPRTAPPAGFVSPLVVRQSLTGTPAVNSLADAPTTAQRIKVGLDDGRLQFTGGFEVRILQADSVGAARLRPQLVDDRCCDFRNRTRRKKMLEW